MAVTYEPIATQTLGSAQASVTFNSFSGYTDLVLVCSPLSSTVDNLIMQFNGDTSNNYSTTIMYGSGSTAGSSRQSSTASPYMNYYAGDRTTPSSVIISIMNYSNATTYKTSISRASDANGGVDAIVSLWRKTPAEAITTIVLKQISANNFAAGSTFTLYGIKAA